jgi:hypothetical protein
MVEPYKNIIIDLDINPIEDNIGEYKLYYQGEWGKLTTPMDEYTSCKLGSKTKWCTAWTEDNRWQEYSDLPLYIWEDYVESKKYQFYFGQKGISMMDQKDEKISNKKWY